MYVCALTNAYSQTAQTYINSGFEKYNKKDFKGAKSDYSKAIKIDDNNIDAYFNRGTCEISLNDYKSAIEDFNKILQINPKYLEAYYSLAIANVKQEKYADALSFLDKAIEIDPTFPNVLTLRGQIRAQTGNIESGCEDFHKAKETGDKQAYAYIKQYCKANENQSKETLMLDWPNDEGWHVASNQEDKERRVFELLRNKETFDNWTEMGTMMVYPLQGASKQNVDMDVYMNLFYENAKKNGFLPKLTFIEKDDKAEFPWIIYKMETNSKTPESQVWQIMQGNTGMYVNFRAVKEKTVPVDLQTKLVAFFKTAKIVNFEK